MTAPADAAREGARNPDGRFGSYRLGESATYLDDDGFPGTGPGTEPYDFDEDPEARRFLVDGLHEVSAEMVREVERVGGHDELRTITSAAWATDRAMGGRLPSQELLASVDYFEDRLVDFKSGLARDRAAQDMWAMGGHDGPDPMADYGYYDGATANAAIAGLRKARTLATGRVSKHTDFEMYSDEANDAVREEVALLAARIDEAPLDNFGVREAIKAHIRKVALRFPEVHDSEPENQIVATLNPALERSGYALITREHLGPVPE